MVLYKWRDHFSANLNNFKITIGSNICNYKVCVEDGGNVEGQTKIVRNCLTPLFGRFVKVELKWIGFERALTLCEIEVYESKRKIPGKFYFNSHICMTSIKITM